MITRKQYPNHHVYEMEIGGRAFTVETGKVAELANAECICRYGDTVVLTTCTCNPIPKAGIDYFPLTIEFEERMYSVGRIPGSFNRREGKPSERGILNSRIIDRPMRPLFDEELRNDTVVTCTVLANDHENPVEIVASLGASIAIASSDVPWNGPVATTNVAHVNGEYIINPSAEEREACDCFVCISSTFEKVVMIETEANEAPEAIVYESIRIAHETNMEIVKFINGIVAEIGKPKFTFEKAAVNHDLLDDLIEYGLPQIEHALDTDDKNIREERLTAARIDFKNKFVEKYGEEEFEMHIEVCLYKMQKKVVKKWLLAGKRVDGRGMDEIRPLDAEVGILPRVHGSGLFARGQTQVLSICTLNTLSAAQKLDTIYPEETKRYIHHYNFPSFSTGEARAARSTSRREIGHGALAEKALLPVIPSVEEFPYAIRVVSEVLSSNGSTSQGSICGSTLALMDAGVPIKRPVAGISCGLISDQETGEWRTFTDIQGVEDFHGEMDFKVAGTTEGITAIQMDLKNKGLTMEIIADALERCRVARLEILDQVMLPCISEPRAEVSEYAPKMISLTVPVDKIREIIGSGGKTIQKICADTGAKVDIEDDGSVFISAVDTACAMAAKKMIDDICFVPEVGKLYYGKVVRILPIGAFVEIAPGHDGMVHISKLENRRVEKVEDVLNLGDMTWVKFMGFDEKGRANFSRKDALKEMEGQQ
ncbi:MAG: polyribonucleotide nucleotidyltransferase [Oscillospiraceae bacterium]|nr:polyribonucleotide nucleotidyltransferase [Oscillospiraceae bacterium]MBQ8797751.1 polyribonucleotide nucleotidyltransferase [Oscillospiraceae bacterium]